MTENRRIFWNVVATYGRSLYGIVLGLLCGRWTLMALGEINYGLNGLVGGLAIFISFFNGVLAGAIARFYAYSVGAAKVSKDMYSALEECRRWFNIAVGVHIIVPIFLIAIGYPLGVYAVQHWLTIPSDRVEACVWVFRFVCLSCFTTMVNVPFMAMYTAKQYIAELTIYSFATSTLNVVVLHYMVTHPRDWLVLYSAWVCITVVIPQIIICVRACFVFPECRINPAYMCDLSRLRRLGVFSGWQSLGAFCSMLRTQGISIVINKFFGARMNAAQTVGNTVQVQCTALGSALQGAFVPVITQACGAGDFAKMNRFAIRTCKFNVLLSVVFMIPLALELPEVMRLWLQFPPKYAVGLCYCAMIFYLVSASTVGHMTVVNAVGRIAAYHISLCSINMFTIPIAIVVGLVWRNVYAIMGTVIFMEVLNSAGRIVFARRYARTSIRCWIRETFIPSTVLIIVCSVVGLVPRMIMEESFLRVVIVSVFTTCSFLPLTWSLFLSSEEKLFVVERFRRIMSIKGTRL